MGGFDPFIPAGFDDPSIGFDDPNMGFDGPLGPPALPTITGISPNSGPDTGGTTITITGANLAGATAVTVGGTAATIVSNTATELVVTSPAHIAGTVHTRVTTSAGSTTNGPLDQFTYTSSPPPGVPTTTGVSPAAGPAAGGTTVTVTGTGFTAATAVSFGELPAAFVPVDDTRLQATAPAQAPGPVDVTVTAPTGTSGITPADIYSYFAPRPPRTRRWVILTRDATFTPRAQVEDFTGLTFIVRHNAVGTFTLTLPAGSPARAVLDQPQAGIIVLADNRVVFSGPIRNRLRTSRGGNEQLVVSGVDDMFLLAARRAHMEPHTVAPPYDSYAYDVRTGLASSVLSQYVAVNAGIAAIASRRIPVLSVAPDPALGSVVTGSARMQPLLDILQQLALASHPPLGFRVRQSGAALMFSTFVPVNRFGSVIFSGAAGTLGDFAYEEVGSQANYIYSFGNGSGTNRRIVEGEDGADINKWGRVEGTLDRSDLGTDVELEQAIAAELLSQASTFRMDLQIVDTGGQEWLTSYDLGDRVGVVVDGVHIPELVREVQVDVGPGGDIEKVSPSVSSPSPKATVREQALFSIVRDLRSRVTNLERNR